MKLKKFLSDCGTVTIKDGFVQGVHGQYVGQSFVDNLCLSEIVSVSSKGLIEALKILSDDFKVFIKQNSIILVDELSSVELTKLPGNFVISFPENFIKSSSLAASINIAQKFISSDFQALKLADRFCESVTVSSVVRAVNDVDLGCAYIPTGRVPSNETGFYEDSEFVWLRYDDEVLGIKKQSVVWPNTDRFFGQNLDYSAIPSNIVSQLISSDFIIFSEGFLLQETEGTVQGKIECKNVQGKYSWKQFSTLVKLASFWCSTDTFISFKDAKLEAILENVDQ